MSVTCHAILESSFDLNEKSLSTLLEKLNDNLDDFRRVPYIDWPDIRQAKRWELFFKNDFSSFNTELEENGYITVDGPNRLGLYLSPKAIVLTEHSIWRRFLYQKKYTLRFRRNTFLFCKLIGSKRAIYVPDATHFGVTPFELFETGNTDTQLFSWIITHLEKINTLPVPIEKNVHFDGYFIEEIETQ
jgi:hypothetical protein